MPSRHQRFIIYACAIVAGIWIPYLLVAVGMAMLEFFNMVDPAAKNTSDDPGQ